MTGCVGSPPSRIAILLFLLCVSVAGAASARAWQDLRPTITLHVPQPQEFELALDEVQLEWTDVVAGKRVPQPVASDGARLLRREGNRAVFLLDDVLNQEALVARVRALEAANPGARGELILYDLGSVRSDATRHVLTRDVGIVLKDPADPDTILDRFAPSLPRSVSGVPGGFVITADDPLAAVALADVLRQQPRVASAVPLMRKVQYTR